MSDRRIHILDCTLRDGGFVNNWKFGHECIINIMSRLDRANIDIIEVGYLRNSALEDKDSTEFPDTKSIKALLGNRKYNSMVVAIIDYGKCGIESISKKDDTAIDGIRLTFKKNEVDLALEFAKKIKKLGYKLFLQPVAITDYDAADVISFIEKANFIDPFAVYMVDTYGFMSKYDLVKYFYLFDTSLKDSVALGYHSHNNFQLSYSNSVELVELASKRELIIDATVFGMGKGAGNLNTELITSYINHNIADKYDVDQVLEIISLYVDEIKRKYGWGYNLRYFLSASTDTHHQYAHYLIEKKTLSIESITSILSKIEGDRRTHYDEAYIELLYNEYQNVSINDQDDIRKLKKQIEGKGILLLGPGGTIRSEKNRIDSFIQEVSPIVIAVNNLLVDYPLDYIFVSNSIRYSQIEDESYYYNINGIKIIATSNISPVAIEPEIKVNYKNLLVKDGSSEIADNSALMLINLLVKIGIKEIYIAGLDGYDDNSEYYKEGIALTQDLTSKTKMIQQALKKFDGAIELKFITSSKYKGGSNMNNEREKSKGGYFSVN